MRHYIFYREDNDFSDLLSEKFIYKVHTKLFYSQHLIISGNLEEEEVGYILLKYGDEMVNPIPDFSPVPYKDYIPKKSK